MGQVARRVKGLLRHLLRPLLGARALQPFYSKLHGFALAGMNFDRSWDLASSGEVNVLHRLAKLLQARAAPARIFDVGANAGQYTESVLAVFGDRVEVHSFEPSAAAFQHLVGRLQKVERVRLHHCGLGERDGETAELHQEIAGVGTATLHRASGDSSRISESVSLRSVDAVCRELGIDHIDLLKIDTEGHELHVLRGARSLIETDSVDLIQFEMSQCDVSSRTFFRDFWRELAPRYRMFRLVRDGWYPIPEYRSKYEIFMNINYLAVHRKIQW